MDKTLKQKTIKGTFWSSVENISVQGIRFLFGLIMARLLSPEEFGLIGMITVFMLVAQTFVDSGFANALVRNNQRTELDFSTAFYFNIVVGAFVYFILFVSSPFIASFYDMPILEDLTKVICLNIVINSLGIVQGAKLTIAVDFKSQAKVTTISVLISGFIGIYLAYSGLGVWALVVQSLLRNFLNVIFLWFVSRWIPKLQFSWSAFKTMFNFGYKLLLSGLIDTIYRNITILIIGKVFSATDLGNYTRAQQFAALPSSNLTRVLGRVTFPILSSIQDDDSRLRSVYSKYLRFVAFIVFPLMVILAALSKPLILLILTDKWADAIPYLQIICFAMMWYPIHAINLNLLQVKGRSDLFLKLEIIKKIIGVTLLIIAIPMGIIYLIIGSVISSIICLAVNTHYTGKIINLGFWRQMKDILPMLFISLLMGGIVWGINYYMLSGNYFLQLIIGGLVGFITYVSLAYILRMKEMAELLNLMKFNKRNGR